MSFIDLHSHVFPGMDDGAKTEEEALAMLEAAVKHDIKILYVTPHREPNGRFDPENDTVIKAWRKLRRLASARKLDVDVRYGEEFRIKTDSIELIKNNQVLTYRNTDYVLIEFTRTTAFSKLIDQAIEAFLESGKKILIAHPERYFDDLKEGIESCRKWVEKGCYLQINRTSLTGFHGIFAEKLANRLIKSGLAHCIASDAHEGEGPRGTRLDDVYQQVIKQHNKTQADLLFFTNPLLLTNNQPMMPVLKPTPLKDQLNAVKDRLRPKKKAIAPQTRSNLTPEIPTDDPSLEDGEPSQKGESHA